MKKKVKCDACDEGREAFIKKDKEAFEKFGWVAHIIGDADDAPYGFNYHTHGIPASFPGAMDIQIVYPIPPMLCHTLANEYVALLKGGKRYKAGDKSSDILKDYDVEFIEAYEVDRFLLRMILPDKKNRTAKDKIGAPYDKQWTNLKTA